VIIAFMRSDGSPLIVALLAGTLSLSISAPSSESTVLSDRRDNSFNDVVHEEGSRKTRPCVCESSGCQPGHDQPTASRWARNTPTESPWCYVKQRCKHEIKRRYAGGYYSEEPCKTPVTSTPASPTFAHKAPQPDSIVPVKRIATGMTGTSSGSPNGWMSGSDDPNAWMGHSRGGGPATISELPTIPNGKTVEKALFPYVKHAGNSCSDYSTLKQKVKDGDAEFTPNDHDSEDVAEKAKEACMKACGKHVNCISFELMTEPQVGHICYLSAYCNEATLPGMDLCQDIGATCSTFTKVFLKGYEHP